VFQRRKKSTGAAEEEEEEGGGREGGGGGGGETCICLFWSACSCCLICVWMHHVLNSQDGKQAESAAAVEEVDKVTDARCPHATNHIYDTHIKQTHTYTHYTASPPF
jgi:hypothetical protein